MQEVSNTNLRMNNYLNYYDLLNHKILYGNKLSSNVEYVLRKKSVLFSNLHSTLLNKNLNGSIVVDVGCGQLPYGCSFKNYDVKKIFALDLDEVSLDIANKHNKEIPVMFVRCGAYKLPFASESVDIVISSEVLEHLDEPLEHLKEIYRILKPNGLLSLSTPSISIYFQLHQVLRNPFNVKGWNEWYKRLNAHKHWKEALSWHPALRPTILNKWISSNSMTVIKHTTTLLPNELKYNFIFLFFRFLEKIGISNAAKTYEIFLNFIDNLMLKEIPIIKWLGIRQFIIAKKR